MSKPRLRRDLAGRLEIDYGRGVIYFHASNPRIVDEFHAVTILRIQGISFTQNQLSRPIDLNLSASHLLPKT